MGDVVVTYKITPDNSEVDMGRLMEEVKALIPDAATVQRFEQVPLAFGLKAIELNFVISDKIGGTDAFEEKVEALDNVASITVEEMGLA